MKGEHHYSANIEWTGNKGTGTDHYSKYDRSHQISVQGKPVIEGSSDPAFRGDPSRHNPEELLVSSISSCHMLWYLHLCSEAGVVVLQYRDQAEGIMIETSNGGGRFTEVTLHPEVIVAASSMIDKANQLHQRANELCFIANSVNFPVRHLAKARSLQTTEEI